MAKSTTKPTKTAPKTKAKVNTEPEIRENRYSRSARIIAAELGIEAAALSKAADMSMSTAKHCREAWTGITSVLLEHGAFTPEWVNQLSPKPQEAEPAETEKSV